MNLIVLCDAFVSAAGCLPGEGNYSLRSASTAFTRAARIELPASPARVSFARELKVLIWTLERIAPSRASS